jgi:uncharacterized protein (TIGR00255 family)
MLKSMTAYAFAERSDGKLTVSTEIRSYNSRYLDLVTRLPLGYAGFEDKLKVIVANAMERGRVELRISIRDDSEDAKAYVVDLQRADAYHTAVTQLAGHLNLCGTELPITYLLNVPGIIQPAEKSIDANLHWNLTESVVSETLVALDQMRRKEGAFIEQDFLQRLEIIERNLRQIENTATDMVSHYRDRLQNRIEALTQGLVEIDLTRITQEACILADRSDISEEIVRAKSHIMQFRTIMAADEPAGRKLNFLLQEFNREFNTMGAKVGQADLAHVIVEIKAEIEKLREQVQNIE